MAGGGRPRDPLLTERVIAVSIKVLGTLGMRGFTGEEIAAAAEVGKASLYRRWRHMDELLVDVVEDLGVRDVDYGPGPGTARSDLFKLLSEATTGPRALAEAAVLSQIGCDGDLRKAYGRGPVVRFFRAAGEANRRAVARGETWPLSLTAILVGWTSLLYQVATTGQQPNMAQIAYTVDEVVLPALLARVAVPS